MIEASTFTQLLYECISNSELIDFVPCNVIMKCFTANII